MKYRQRNYKINNIRNSKEKDQNSSSQLGRRRVAIVDMNHQKLAIKNVAPAMLTASKV